jgi:hypothetical protein
MSRAPRAQFTPTEKKLVEQLRRHPEMMARVQGIIEVARNDEGLFKDRRRGRGVIDPRDASVGQCHDGPGASQAEERVSRELKSQDLTVLSRKKER